VSVLYVALPVCLAVSFAAVLVFSILVRSGQFDDLETPPRRILYDDDVVVGSGRRNAAARELIGDSLR
jgi:cbb3-type cytochrome oxidase maturation protein